MKKLVIIGANDFQNRLILKAKSMGYETHVFAWQDGSIGEETADYFYPVSIIEKEEILEKCKEIKPDGICSIASDLATVTVNYVASNLGLAGNPDSSTVFCTNKYEMRKKLNEFGIPTPKFIKITEEDTDILLDGMEFPLIVKPTDRSGSRAVNKVFNKEELLKAAKEACSCSFEKSAIVEEYLRGKEYSCECISYKGKHHFLAFTTKFTTGSPNFIEKGHIEPSDIDKDKQEEIKNFIFKALTALGIENGASHTEFKIDDNGKVGIVEIGSRMGGGCIGSDLVMISTGYDYVKMVIDIAVGKSPSFEKVMEPKTAVIKFIFNDADLAEMNDFIKNNPDKIYRVSEINMEYLNNVSDDSDRAGYYIYTLD